MTLHGVDATPHKSHATKKLQMRKITQKVNE